MSTNYTTEYEVCDGCTKPIPVEEDMHCDACGDGPYCGDCLEAHKLEVHG